MRKFTTAPPTTTTHVAGVTDSGQVLGAKGNPIKESNFKAVINYLFTPSPALHTHPKGVRDLVGRIKKNSDTSPLYKQYVKKQQYGTGARMLLLQRPSLWI